MQLYPFVIVGVAAAPAHWFFFLVSAPANRPNKSTGINNIPTFQANKIHLRSLRKRTFHAASGNACSQHLWQSGSGLHEDLSHHQSHKVRSGTTAFHCECTMQLANLMLRFTVEGGARKTPTGTQALSRYG